MSKLRPVRQRTGASRQDEGPGTGAALLAGAVLGLATDAVALALPRQQARLLSGAHLATAGGVYLGFAVADGRRSALLVQAGELLGFTALTALAVQRDSPGLPRIPTYTSHPRTRSAHSCAAGRSAAGKSAMSTITCPSAETARSAAATYDIPFGNSPARRCATGTPATRRPHQNGLRQPPGSPPPPVTP